MCLRSVQLEERQSKHLMMNEQEQKYGEKSHWAGPMEEKRGEGEWDPKDPGYWAKGESEEAEEWVWHHLGFGGKHSLGNTPNFKGGLAHKTS